MSLLCRKNPAALLCGAWLLCAVPAAAQTPPAQTNRGEQVMKALAAAYPGRVAPAVFRKTAGAVDGDWAAQIDGVWFYYAQGRLLPEQLRNRYAEYDPQPFYNYPAELPPWTDPGPEETRRFRDAAQRRADKPPKRSQHFFDALWRAGTREEAYERVKTMRFLGRSVMVHYSIMEELALVEERIQGLAQTSAELRQWINRLDSLTGWNWRVIADTQSRSFHAYGAALDLLPSSHGGLQTYWLWTAENFPSWWAVPYERRSHPPEAVIRAFEEYGFIWGGKWLFFDTMHFEYRPEILLLNNMTFKPAA
ncbi:MAG: M15 family metallopeptidase [Treponema sp.]|jgi:hypothetical protein|nr:M15 family metallopeptidase [Treponema sp.]